MRGFQDCGDSDGCSPCASDLQGLKKIWEQLHHEYQGLPLVIDTISQKQHKQCLEAKMSQVEKDMDILERFKTIYIPNE